MTDETRQAPAETVSHSMSHDGPCACCRGTGKTTDIVGLARPCSRCDVEGFERWLKERRPVAEQLITSQRPEET